MVRTSKIINLVYLVLTTWVFTATIGYAQVHQALVGSGEQGEARFIENKNQWPAPVKFAANLPGGRIFLQPGKFLYHFYDQKSLQAWHHGHDELPLMASILAGPIDGISRPLQNHVFEVKLLGANLNAIPLAEGQPDVTIHHYHLGNNPNNWGHGARGFHTVRYPAVYPGIDMVWRMSEEGIKYDFELNAYADPRLIKLDYQFTEGLDIRDGALHIATSVNHYIEQKPVAFQQIEGQRKPVACQYVLEGNRVGFKFPEGYNPVYPLIIDPALIFSTYSGSTDDNFGNTAAFDDEGNLYAGGIVMGQGFPDAVGGFPTEFSDFWDVGLLKFDSSGSQLLYRTYFGGAQMETPHSLVVNSRNELIVLGSTSSTDMPTSTNAYQRRFAGGSGVQPLSNLVYENGSDAFLCMLSPNGEPIAATYIGGTENDGLLSPIAPLAQNYGDQMRGDVITDDDNNVYIASSAGSSNYFGSNPSFPSFQNTYQGGGTDAIVLKMDREFTQIIWGGFLGGGGDDVGLSIKLGQNREVYVGGGTNSTNSTETLFPTTVGTIQPNPTRGVDLRDGYLAVISSDGTTIERSTFIGTGAYDQVYFIGLDTNEDIYVLGQTLSNTFPVTAGVYNNPRGKQFIQKIDNSLSNVMFSTVFGSGGNLVDISLTAFLVNDCDNLYVSGWGGGINSNGQQGYFNGNTFGMPVTPNAIKPTTDGRDFYLMALRDDGSELLYASFFGGNQTGNISGEHVDGGTSRFDKRGIIYQSVCGGCGGNSLFPTSDDFPNLLLTPPHSSTNPGPNCNNAALKFDLANLDARFRTNNLARNSPGINQACLRLEVLFENTSVGGETYIWDFGDGSPQVTVDNKDPIPHKYDRIGQYRVKLIALDRTTCIGEDSTFTDITIYEDNFAIGPGGDICSGDLFNLMASGADTYRWQALDGAFDSDLANPGVSPGDTTAYAIRLDDRNGCFLDDTVTVNVVESVDAAFSLMTTRDCLGPTRFDIENQSEGPAQLFWDLGDGTLVEGEESVSHEYEEPGDYTIRLRAVNSICADEQSIDIAFRDLVVYNVITPGAKDGKNDFFVVSAEASVSIKIFNRWGGLVFEDDAYENQWDGEGLASGIYYYDIALNDDVGTTCQGWVHLLK